MNRSSDGTKVTPELGPVLYPTDFTEGARVAFPYAVYMAALFDSEIHALHVSEGGSSDGESAGEEGFPAAEEVSAQVRPWLEGAGVRSPSGDDGGSPVRMRQELVRGDAPASGIRDYVGLADAGIVCMGTHGHRGLRRLVLGSVTEQVVREVRCPVLTVRQGIPGWEDHGPRRILAAVDLSPMMEPALAWAGLLAAASGGQLAAYHAVKSAAGVAVSGKRQRIHRAFSELDVPDVALDTELVAGDPAPRISEEAQKEDFDLIVTATHGRSGPSRLVLGSVAEGLVRRAPCPVLTVSDPPAASD